MKKPPALNKGQRLVFYCFLDLLATFRVKKIPRVERERAVPISREAVCRGITFLKRKITTNAPKLTRRERVLYLLRASEEFFLAQCIPSRQLMPQATPPQSMPTMRAKTIFVVKPQYLFLRFYHKIV